MPINLTDCTAYMLVYPSAASNEVFLELSDTNGRITIMPLEGKLELYIEPTATAQEAWRRALYYLEVTYPNGDVLRHLQGKITLSPARDNPTSEIKIGQPPQPTKQNDGQVVIEVSPPTNLTIDVGIQGPPGPPGERGLQGVQGPPGPLGDDAHKTIDVLGAMNGTVTINHNLSKYPHVDFFDANDNRVRLNISHTDINTLVLSWQPITYVLSGRLVLN